MVVNWCPNDCANSSQQEAKRKEANKGGTHLARVSRFPKAPMSKPAVVMICVLQI